MSDPAAKVPVTRHLKAALARYIPTRAQIQAMVENSSRATVVELENYLAGIKNQLQDLTDTIASLRASVERAESLSRADAVHLGASIDHVDRLARAQIDEIALTQWQLSAVRASAEYEATLSEKEPLVTVRIATYNRPGPLMERAIPSVLRQTYDRLEVIVVGDGCSDDTGDQIARLGDDRVRFVNLPYRFPYPEDQRNRWLVAGSPAMNVGAQLARGSWIAPLDDDDEFLGEHVEKLLRTATGGGFEMAYGNVVRKAPDPTDDLVLASHPPRYANFGFQAAIYMSCLRFMHYDPRCWMLDESGDWNLCRRMMEAGVRIGWLDEVVSWYYPSRLWSPGEVW